MKNVYMLPTDDQSRLSFYEKLELNDEYTSSNHFWIKNQHLYVTSNEKIKEGDLVLYEINGTITFINVTPIHNNAFKDKFGYECSLEFCKKIVLTTDKKLIKDGIQAINDEFLEWFIKNPSCEFVSVEYNEYEMFGNKSKKWIDSHSCYEIIIPKEEPTTCECGANTSCQCGPEKPVKDLEYWKNNAEEDYMTTPISVLRYISELEKEVELLKKK